MIVAVNAIHAKGGGGTSYLKNILPVLGVRARPGEAFRVIGRRGQEGLVADCGPAVSFHEVNAPASTLGGLLWEQARLPGVVRRLGADVLFCPQNYIPLRGDTPSVLYLRNSLEAGRQARGLYQKAHWRALGVLTRASLARASAVLAVSRTLAEEFGMPRGRHVTIVPHGIHSRFSPGPAGPHPMADRGARSYFLFVSTVYRHKNLLGLVRGFAQVAGELPGHDLAIVGQVVDAGYEAEVRDAVRQAGLEERVTWAGLATQEQLPDWYRHATALVFPSFAESFGNPPLEAMACGTPVLAARAGAMPEVCGTGAAFFDPSRPDEIAALLRKVAGDPAFARELSHRGVDWVSRYSWEAAADAVLGVLRGCLDPATPGPENHRHA